MSTKLIKRGGIWWITGTVSGRRIRRSTRTRSKADAESIRVAEESRITQAALFGPAKVATFAEACLGYLSAGKSPRFVEPILIELGPRRLADITPGEIKDIARKLYPNAGPATHNRQGIAPARAIINHAADRGLCSPIRVRNLPTPRVRRPAGDRDWIDAFRAHCPSPHLRTLTLLMFVTGARVGEAIKLAPGHLDLDAKIARILDTKNGHPRTAYLTNELVAELRALEPRRIRHGRGPLRVFGYASGRSFYAMWDATVRAAGIKRLTPHEAGRHGFGTETIVRQGVDVATAAEMGGWRDVRVLLETYVHPENLSDAAEAMFGRSPKLSPVTPLAQPRKKIG